MYFVYILKCADNTLYTGVTNDLQKRLEAHNFNDTGAKYTRGRRPVRLVYKQKFKDKSEAMRAEIRIKKLTRDEKLVLIKEKRLP